MSEVKIPFEALRDQINSAVDLIVQLSRGADGSRRITEIAAVTSQSREEFQLTPLMRFRSNPVGADRKVTGVHEMLEIPAPVAERLWSAGHQLSAGFRIAADSRIPRS
jgi:pilus assembly protein CpaF